MRDNLDQIRILIRILTCKVARVGKPRDQLKAIVAVLLL